MTHDYKVTLRDIVELFYQSPFKIFNVNSIDGETLIKPFGYFISLGITTSFEQLGLIRDYILKSDYGFDARLVEICSVKSEKYGDYLNTLLPTEENQITKYPSPIPSDIQILWNKDQVEEYMKDICGDLKLSPLRHGIYETLEKIGDDWDTKAIQIKNGVVNVFYRYVNYKRENTSEYRIGIYATKP